METVHLQIKVTILCLKLGKVFGPDWDSNPDQAPGYRPSALPLCYRDLETYNWCLLIGEYLTSVVGLDSTVVVHLDGSQEVRLQHINCKIWLLGIIILPDSYKPPRFISLFGWWFGCLSANGKDLVSDSSTVEIVEINAKNNNKARNILSLWIPY